MKMSATNQPIRTGRLDSLLQKQGSAIKWDRRDAFVEDPQLVAHEALLSADFRAAMSHKLGAKGSASVRAER